MRFVVQKIIPVALVAAIYSTQVATLVEGAAPDVSKENFHLYLLAGQSNTLLNRTEVRTAETQTSVTIVRHEAAGSNVEESVVVLVHGETSLSPSLGYKCI